MKTSARIRRSRSEWQSIIQDWQQSGQSAPDYCSDHDITYTSFSHWRRRLAQVTKADQATGDFIDLSSLSGSADPTWRVTLKLGDGMELVISR